MRLHYGPLMEPLAILSCAATLKHTAEVVSFETAHPSKFIDTVETAMGQKPPIPARLMELAENQNCHSLGTKYQEFKSFLLSRKSK